MTNTRTGLRELCKYSGRTVQWMKTQIQIQMQQIQLKSKSCKDTVERTVQIQLTDCSVNENISIKLHNKFKCKYKYIVTNTFEEQEQQGHGWENCANTVDGLFISAAVGGRVPTLYAQTFLTHFQWRSWKKYGTNYIVLKKNR